MAATYILRGRDKKKPLAITLIYRFGSERVTYTTGLKVLSKDWDKRNNEFKATYVEGKLNEGLGNLAEINKQLHQMRQDANTIYNALSAAGKLNAVTLRNAFIDKFTPKDETPVQNGKVVAFLAQFLLSPERADGELEELAPNTIRNFNTTKRILKQYETSTRKKILFAEIDKDFFKHFKNYLHKKRKYSPSSIASVIKDIKTLAQHAIDADIEVNTFVFSRKFKAPKRTASVHVYLTSDELIKLSSHNYSTASLDRVKDWFLIGVYTGLRVSDFLRLNTENIIEEKGARFISIENEKTKKITIVGIRAKVEAILEKYNGCFPPKISSQKFNKYIKDACLEAGIVDLVKSSLVEMDDELGEPRLKVGMFPKYSLVSSHTCRRTFITLNRGTAKDRDIIKITGHSNVAIMENYDKSDKLDAAIRLKEQWDQEDNQPAKLTKIKHA